MQSGFFLKPGAPMDRSSSMGWKKKPPCTTFKKSTCIPKMLELANPPECWGLFPSSVYEALLGSNRGVVKVAAIASKMVLMLVAVWALSVQPLLELVVSA
jgi:hypothetical protein